MKKTMFTAALLSAGLLPQAHAFKCPRAQIIRQTQLLRDQVWENDDVKDSYLVASANPDQPAVVVLLKARSEDDAFWKAIRIKSAVTRSYGADTSYPGLSICSYAPYPRITPASVTGSQPLVGYISMTGGSFMSAIK